LLYRLCRSYRQERPSVHRVYDFAEAAVTTDWIALAGCVGVNLLPVPAFLGALRLLDSYKLLTLRRTFLNILAGCAVAAVCYGINTAAFAAIGDNRAWYVHYAVPV